MIFQCTCISILVLSDWRKTPQVKVLKLAFKKKRQSNYIWYKSSSLNEINISEFAWVEISYYSLACYASNAMYSDKTYQNEMMLLWNSNKVAQNNLRLLSKMAALH